jgi:CTD small phosphatase-like protein 2
MAVFTAAEQTYADLIIDVLDPDKLYFGDRRLYRQHCVARGTEPGQPSTEGNKVYVKDLRILGDRELTDVLIVDNSILSFAFQLDNGVPICSFFSGGADRGQSDQELLYLLTYLEDAYYHQDARVANRKMFKLSDYLAKLQ